MKPIVSKLRQNVAQQPCLNFVHRRSTVIDNVVEGSQGRRAIGFAVAKVSKCRTWNLAAGYRKESSSASNNRIEQSKFCRGGDASNDHGFALALLGLMHYSILH